MTDDEGNQVASKNYTDIGYNKFFSKDVSDPLTTIGISALDIDSLFEDQSVGSSKLAVSTISSTTSTDPSETTSGEDLVTLTGTQTLTNKRITKRVTSITSSATPTPAANTTDIFIITALATNATFGAPTGTPTNGQTLMMRIIDNGSARTLSFNSIYNFPTDIPAPTTTTASKFLYLGFAWNTLISKWDCIALVDGF